ncbi:hypothetical protein V2J09_000096 [Rumex salicifolius]
MLAFSPLFSPQSISGFFSAAQQHLPLIQEIGTFSFPIDHHHDQVLQNLPNSTHFELDRCYNQPNWDAVADYEVLNNPTPAVLPQPPPEDTTAEEVIKKKHHNASERMRRRKLNGLFAALSSVLPGADQMKKQTAPTTVERVIKYIPDLRNQVESLTQRKQQLLLSTTKPTPTSDDVVFAPPVASWLVDAVEVGDGEVSILISTAAPSTIPISYVLHLLEEEGLAVVGVSSSESPSGRLFYHIHLHRLEEGRHEMDSEMLRMKLMSSGRKWDDMCLWMMTQRTQRM